MVFQSALTTDQLETLRGTTDLSPRFTGRVAISACPNDTVYSARVNQASFGNSFAQVTYDGGSGTLADVRTGQRVLISHTNDKNAAFFDGLVRKTPTSTILYINETSKAVADNDYIWVIDDYPLRDKLGREDDNGTFYPYYDTAFRQLLPVIYNLDSVYAAEVDPDTGEATFSLSPLVLIATSGATSGTWLWEIGDCSFDTGSSSSQNVVITAPEGHRWIHVSHTDSGGRVMTRHIEVHAHGDTYTPQFLAAENVLVTGQLDTGYDATLTGFSTVANVLNQTQITIWSPGDSYQDGETLLGSSNILFVGRIRTVEDDSEAILERGLDARAEYTLEGPLTQLSRTEQLPYEMLNVTGTPTAFGTIKNATIWRDIVYLLSEFSTFLELHSLSFDNVTDAYLAPARNPQGNILAATNNLAESINAALQMSPAGRGEIVRDARMLEYDPDNTDERDNLTTVANWTVSDLYAIRHNKDHARTVGRMEVAGGSYVTSADLYTPYKSLAPGLAQESGEGQGNLNGQVLTANASSYAAQLELDTRAGHAFEMAQTAPTIEAKFADGHYGVLIPSRNVWHTFTLDGSETVSGVVLTSTQRWLLTQVTIVHNGDGTKDVTALFTAETYGTPGLPVAVELGGAEPSPVPYTPDYTPIPAYPTDPIFNSPPSPTGSQIPTTPPPITITPRTDGSVVVTGTDTELWLAGGFITSLTPRYRNIHPEPGATVRAFAWQHRKLNDRGGLALIGDESTTTLYRTDDVFGGLWTAGEVVDGVYTALRLKDTKNKLYILSTSNAGGSSPGTVTYDFTVSQWGFTIPPPGGTATNGFGNYVASTGFTTTLTGSYYFGSAYKVLSIAQVTEIRLYVSDVAGTIHFHYNQSTPGNFGATLVSATFDTDHYKYTFGSPTDITDFQWYLDKLGAGITVTKLEFDSDSITAGEVVTRYSDDNGDTFALPETLADSSVNVGFDTIKNGSVVIGGGDGTMRKAVTAGGMYSDYGDPLPALFNPLAVYVPYYQFGSLSSLNGNIATPDMLVGSDGLTASNEALFKITGSGVTQTDITPVRSGEYGLSISPNSLTMPVQSGKVIVGIFEFAGSRFLFISTDSGATWTDAGILDADADYVRVRRNDTALKYAYFANGGPAFTPAYRAAVPTVYTRLYPSTDPIRLIEPFGG